MIEFPVNELVMDYELDQQYDDYYGEEEYDCCCDLSCESLEIDGRVNVRGGIVGWLREVVRSILVGILNKL